MQLTKTERKEIALFLEKGYKIKDIARMVKRDPSVVSREIRRNSVNGRYDAEKAHHKKYVRRHDCYIQFKKIALNRNLQNYIEEKLKFGWSPEKIAGRWNLEHPEESVIHFQRIYEWAQGNRPNLARYFLRAKDRPKRRRRLKGKRQLIPNRVWIDERPEAANKRAEMGHFEGDTIVSKKEDRSVILTMTDRKSRYLVAKKMPNKKAQPMAEVMRNITESLNIKTLTLDNGIEFQKHEQINCPTYFCHPYSSWEKGTIENTNGLIRRYVPKKTRIKDVSVKKLNQIVWRLNNTPRKCLNYLTPREVHFAKWNQST